MNWQQNLEAAKATPQPPSKSHLFLATTSAAASVVNWLMQDMDLPAGTWKGWEWREDHKGLMGSADPDLLLEDIAELLACLSVGVVQGDRDASTVAELLGENGSAGSISVADLLALAMMAGLRDAYFDALNGAIRFGLTCGFTHEQLQRTWLAALTPGKGDAEA